MRVVIGAGGTAGHVSPALALAREMAAAHEVKFIGTASGVEARMVPAAGFALDFLEVGGFDRSRPWTLPLVAGRAGAAVVAARRALAARRPDVVVGMGGYVSLPVVVAAYMLRIPVVVHEQNIVVGLANRVARRMARRVAVSFDETLAQAGPRGVVTGNPVSRSISRLDRDVVREAGLRSFSLEPRRKTLLVFGGSLGALRLNDAAAGLPGLWSHRRDVQVLHIRGSAQAERRPPAPVPSQGLLIYRSVGFVDRMAEAYAVADVALCRSGATTVAELCAAGLPSVLVPYPHHRDRQQERHAEVLARAGAAVVVSDAVVSPERVARETDRIWGDMTTLDRMRAAALDMARPDAADALARVVESVAEDA